MGGLTVMVRLSANSAEFMRKCIGDVGHEEIDAFFETAITALAQALFDFDTVVPLDNKESCARCGSNGPAQSK